MYDKFIKCIIVVCFLLVVPQVVVAKSRPLETVTVQLKWKHQFQFAGYYVAIEKGYYSEVGLNVILKEGRPGLNVTQQLMAGKAEYGIDLPYILINRQNGDPVVVLAAILQHSPLVLFARQSSGIKSPQDLIGKRVMKGTKGHNEINAMILAEGIGLNKIDFITHSWNINDFISGNVDAVTGYVTDIEYILNKRGVDYSILRPLTYGVDFYGDCLFTLEDEINHHPKRVRAFVEATLKGWEYAMSHHEETVDIILKKYSTRLSKDTLLFEAKKMHELMQPEFIEVGHMNPGRWKHIADTYVEIGMLKKDYSLEKFIYDPHFYKYAKVIEIVKWLIGIIALIMILIVVLLIFNHRLNHTVACRTEQLNQEKLFINAIIGSLPGNFVVYENGTKLVRWNKIFQERLGYSDEEMFGMHPLDIFSGSEKEKVAQKLKTFRSHSEVIMFEADATFGDKVVPYILVGRLVTINNKEFLIGLSIDITERREMEERLRQAQKVELIGQLAGSVAHDFNNILSAILGYSEMLLAGMKEGEKYWDEIKIIQNAGEKGSSLTQQLLAFSRKQIMEKKVFSLNTTIENIFTMLKKVFGENIIVERKLSTKGAVIEADQGQVEQIIMNLVVNARDAITTDKGTITITTKEVVVDEYSNKPYPDLEYGQYVLLSISDTGEGIAEDVIDHIFEPFFTTKKVGVGTGLGLGTVYGIVQQHKAHIYVDSTVGQGTNFKIYFQASQKEALIKNDANKGDARLAIGNETILVVDSEATIRRLIVRILEPLGYNCFEAINEQDAFKIADQVANSIDLLIINRVINGVDVEDFVVSMCEKILDLKVLYVSDYEKDDGIADIDDAKINYYVSTPITPLALAQKVRMVFDN